MLTSPLSPGRGCRMPYGSCYGNKGKSEIWNKKENGWQPVYFVERNCFQPTETKKKNTTKLIYWCFGSLIYLSAKLKSQRKYGVLFDFSFFSWCLFLRNYSSPLQTCSKRRKIKRVKTRGNARWSRERTHSHVSFARPILPMCSLFTQVSPPPHWWNGLLVMVIIHHAAWLRVCHNSK